MIFINKIEVRENEFVSLLERAKRNMLDKTPKKLPSPTKFEEDVYKEMCFASKGTSFDGHVELTGAHAFPDIIAKRYFGVEVKMTQSDKWQSTGNSVLESTRVEGVERIFIFFGKFGGKFDIKFRLYQECLFDISVTHSPRYRIDMNLTQGGSIFEKMGTDYDKLRKLDNPIKEVKNYYRDQLEEGEELWWIDEQSELEASAIIRPYRNLTEEEKERFFIDTMILFPEMFSNSSVKFERPAAYLITTFNAVSSNLRDMYTAGGQVALKVKNKKITVPKIIYHLHANSNKIKDRMGEIEEETLKYYWRTEKVSKDRFRQWKDILMDKSIVIDKKVSIIDIFNAGLNEKKNK
jgi:hypothetical protein